MKLLLALLVGALLLAPPAAPAAEREADRAVSSNPARDIVDTGVPGAVVLDRNGVHAAGNVRAHSRFRAGSVTKTFVATVVLQLVEEGRLSLDRPVPGSRGIPVRRLLDHTSGIFNHAEDPRVFAEGC
jgi:D-alanyl-D-alanine carboxypeptidase